MVIKGTPTCALGTALLTNNYKCLLCIGSASINVYWTQANVITHVLLNCVLDSSRAATTDRAMIEFLWAPQENRLKCLYESGTIAALKSAERGQQTLKSAVDRHGVLQHLLKTGTATSKCMLETGTTVNGQIMTCSSPLRSVTSGSFLSLVGSCMQMIGGRFGVPLCKKHAS